MPQTFDLVPPVSPSTPIAKLEDRLRAQLAQLFEQGALIRNKIVEINERLREIECERAENAPAPAKWWYPP